ncbi:uncharacterized protein DUF1329 [Panacagrimonas perspica]|uniref:Uncharacterized protein DUF1329 n=1 Tax=Panacagrimonas perspica TaxID=381431 RepID=A0A4R7P2T7_9GAMM|nr:uncharacterized protein DUF1329 [Panacagrimonas perspica]
MRVRRLLWGLVLACVPMVSIAKVTEEDAQQLRNRLTPMGAERAGDEDGTIPEWRGGMTAPPPCYVAGGRYCDPHPEDKPYVTITTGTREEWRDYLSAGHIALLEANRKTFQMNLYPSRRTFANPGAVYDAAYQNAIKATLSPGGNAVREARIAVPFPMPTAGAEVVWNHRLRWRGPAYRRVLTQASVTPSGEATLLSLREDADFPYARGELGEDGVAQQWLWVVLLPERLQGYLMMVKDSIDGDGVPLTAWRQQPREGEVARRMRKSRMFGFDNNMMLSDDLRFEDQLDGFFGSPERYTWRIVARRPMVVPYNSYALHSGRKTLRSIIRPAHLDPALVRYELHRVWVVEAELKPQALHRHKRRTFYFDEDSWQLLMVDLYDRTDKLWRFQEIHPLMAYDRATLMPAVEVQYDLASSRYLLQGIDENDPERAEMAFNPEHFTVSGARDSAPKK